MTFRSREILNADTIVGNFGFNNNQTSNCAGQPAGCTINSATGFDVASFLLGYTSGKTRNLFDAETYTEKRPEISLYVQDDWRPTSKLTLNMGLRYDVYPPWIEVDDRQSNFDPSTGTFVRGLRQRRHRRRQGRPLPADLLEEGLRPALRLRLRPRRQRQDARPRRLRGVLELHARRHLVVQGAEPAVPAVHGADDLADRLRHQPAAEGRPAAASGRRPEPAAVRHARARSSTSTSATRYARQWNINVQRGLGTNYMLEVAYVGSQGRQHAAQGRPERGPAGRRRDRLEHQPAVLRRLARAALDRPGRRARAS